MKIVLTTENALQAIRLKEKIVQATNGSNIEPQMETWSYRRSSEGFDIIFHDVPQYTNTPEKNVLFTIQSERDSVILSTAWWAENPEPSREMLCLHTGRLVEGLLNYFSNLFIKFSIMSF